MYDEIDINLSDCLASNYKEVFEDLEKLGHFEYWFKGGRGSLKSSFAHIYTIYSMTLDVLQGKTTHCVGLRKVKDTIKDSVFMNFLWAIDMLNLGDVWHYTTSPMRIWYKDSTILFRGCANAQDHQKIKSIKFEKGYCKYALYEELTEFGGIDEIMSINQSLFRGGNEGVALYAYNPPASKLNWVNKEAKIKKDNRYIHHSNYLDVPPKWLGKVFIDEAEQLKKRNPKKYAHMYLGEEIGEGLEIYNNVTIRTITDEEIKGFDRVYRGLDFGFTRDASGYVECYFDRKTDKLYIFNEIYGHGMSNERLYELIYPLAKNYLIYGDSAEPRTIHQLQKLGLNITGASKGKDSVRNGIKWLGDLMEIVIDKKRTPYTAYDFQSYELEKNKQGEIINDYPKEPHASASTRYALSKVIILNEHVFL